MMKPVRILAAGALACVGASDAVAQSKDDVANKISTMLPDNGRGGITASSLRGVMNSLNSARGQPGGIADLDGAGKLSISLVPTLDNAKVGGIDLSAALGGKAPIDANSNIPLVRGINSVSDGTAAFSVKPFWAYFPTQDLIRYGSNFKLTTKYDGESWESALGADFEIKTGYSRAFAAGMTVAAGDNITAVPTGASESYTYRVTQAGTLGSSAATWGGPQSATFTSGTAQLRWINYTNLAAKLGFTTTTFMSENAGSSWGANFNFHMRPLNNQPKFVSGIEQDFHNDSGYDCLLFSGNTCNAYNMYLSGANRATVGLNIGKLNANPVFATEWAVALQGQYLASDAIITINTTNSQYGIGIGRFSGIFGASTYLSAAYRDEATSPVGVSLAGVYSDAAINTTGMTGGDGTAVRLGNFQRQCWGASPGGCVYYDPAIGFVWTTGDAPSGSKFIIGRTGNLNAIGSITGSSFAVGNQAGVTCNAPPTQNFRVVNGIVTAC